MHDTHNRGKEVLRLFVKYGAPESILYDAKPHIGTDILAKVVKNIREAIISMGGEVRFHTKVTGIRTKRSIDFQMSRHLRCFIWKISEQTSEKIY